MSYLVKRFFLFIAVLGVLFGTAFVSFRCGHNKGLKDAPRHYYSMDVSRALRESDVFRHYVDSLYVSTYRSAIDSIIRTDKVIDVVAKWVENHPGCSMSTRKPLNNVGKREFENTFFGR